MDYGRNYKRSYRKRYYGKKKYSRFNRGYKKKTYGRNRYYKKYTEPFKMKEIKTVDHTFYEAAVEPYAPDLLAKTILPMNSSFTVQALMIQQGVGVNQRIGNQVTLKSLRLRFNISFEFDHASVDPTFVRVMVVYDRQPNGAYPAGSAVLSNINEAGTLSAYDPNGDINVTNMDRFVVLLDHYCVVQSVDNATTSNYKILGPTGEESFKVDKYVKLRGLEQRYNGTASPMTVSLINTGALYLISTGELGAGAQPYGLRGKTRLRYYDC